MPQLDQAQYLPQLFWLAVCFITLYLVMAYVALPRIGRVMSERKHSIESDLDAAERFRTEADSARAGYLAAIDDARGNAREMISGAQHEMHLASETRERELDREITEQIESAQQEIAQTRERLLTGLADVAADAAQVATRRLVGIDVKSETAAAAVEKVRRN